MWWHERAKESIFRGAITFFIEQTPGNLDEGHCHLRWQFLLPLADINSQ